MSSTSKKTDKLVLRVDLFSPHKEMFLAIKESNMFTKNSQVAQHCIKEAHNKAEFHLEEVYWEKIRKLMNYDYVKYKQRIYDTKSFINKALDSFFDTIHGNLESIKSFDVRSTLNQEELKVAKYFLKCQEESYSEEVTLDKLATKMGERNIVKLTETIEDFVLRGLVSKLVIDNEVTYHAHKISTF